MLISQAKNIRPAPSIRTSDVPETATPALKPEPAAVFIPIQDRRQISGISSEHDDSTTGSTAEAAPDAYEEHRPWPLRIYTLGRFNLVLNGKPLTFSGKVQQKPLEMLKAVISLGGRNITEKKISDFLWPDADCDEAHRSFTVTLHRLRRLLGLEKLIELHEGRVTLDAGKCWVDVWAFERLAGETRVLLKQGQQGALPLPVLEVAKKAISLYSGDFLSADTDRTWSMSRRERLRCALLRLVRLVGQCHEEREEMDKAIDCYLQGLEVIELAEELYQRLMHCYHRAGRHGEIASTYNRCRITLAMHGIKPSPRTRAIFEQTAFGS